MKIAPVLFVVFLINACIKRQEKDLINEAVSQSPDYQRGEALWASDSKKDSAFYYFTNVTETSKDSLLVAMAYTHMAMMQQDAGDYFGSQGSALDAMRHVDEKNPKHHYCVASIYNELGVSSAALKNYDAAIEYYDLAIRFQPEEAYKTVFENNKAVVYRQKGDFSRAIQILELILEKQMDQGSDYARVVTNLSSLKWQTDSAFNPIPDLLAALEIRKRENNDIDITASYNHLSNYYLSKNADSALYYTKQMYNYANRSSSTEDQLDALKKLIPLAPAMESKAYFNTYQKLSDSVQTARSVAKNQFALIKYKSEKKELKIFRQRVWLYSIAVSALLLFLFARWWYRKKKQQMEWTSEATIKENHLKISQKVHDVVANGLYRMMMEVEHRPYVERERLLDDLEILYDRSRDISYESTEKSNRSGHEEMTALLKSFSTANVSVSIVGNSPDMWFRMHDKQRNELKHILQELMVNMRKHSAARNVVVKFAETEEGMEVRYHDDGIGLSDNLRYGNGLRGTENRINSIGGRIIFDRSVAAGTAILIFIPISKKDD